MQLPLSRRQIILAASMTALGPSVPAQATADGREIELWPGGVPGAARVKVREEVVDATPGGDLRDRVVQHVTRPLLTVFAPRGEPNGITFLVVPGGGYRRVVIDREGYDTAAWLTERGFGAAVLRYRLPADGWEAGPDAPVHDGIRAMRWLRAHGGPNARRIGAIGFSAGGHLVARLITEPALDYPRVDADDERPARPDFAVLMYAVILTTGANAHAGSAQQLIGAGVAPTDLALARYSVEARVVADTPPTLLVHAADDRSVPLENSLRMHEALRAANVRSELHVFESGGHGFGLRGVAGKSVAAWPTLVRTWALTHAAP
jgi:acetyl esterase/lipase